jgi:hypothetical protein
MIASHADFARRLRPLGGTGAPNASSRRAQGRRSDTKWQDWAYQAGPAGIRCAHWPRWPRSRQWLWPWETMRSTIPPIAAGIAAHVLHKLTLTPKANNASQATIDFVLYDLVGYYPLIDGDSVDPQDLDNTLPLPRYADGKGLQLVMVNHVSPGVANGQMTLEYTDSTGTDQTVTRGVPLNGLNFVCSPARNAAVADVGPLTVSLLGEGIRRVNRITYLTPPGGLHCLYLIKPMAQFQHYHDALLQADTTGSKAAIEVDFAAKDGWRMPVVQDGAHLSFFYRAKGGGRTVTFFGDATFVWG